VHQIHKLYYSDCVNVFHVAAILYSSFLRTHGLWESLRSVFVGQALIVYSSIHNHNIRLLLVIDGKRNVLGLKIVSCRSTRLVLVLLSVFGTADVSGGV